MALSAQTRHRLAANTDLCDDASAFENPPTTMPGLVLNAIVLLLMVSLVGCATGSAPPPAAAPGADAAAKPPSTCEPEPFCYRDCMRGYAEGYCRFKCGCR